MFPRDDAPEEPRAEIIEVTNRPLARLDETHAATFRAPSGGSSSERRSRRRAAMAAAGLVLVLGLAALASRDNLFALPPAHISPTPASIFPATAAGLPVIRVDIANGDRSAGSIGAAELAVGGWYTAARSVATCQPSGQPVGTCSGAWTARLLSTSAPIFVGAGTQPTVSPETSSLQPVFVDPVSLPSLASSNPTGTAETIPPTPLVLVGHFHDDRAAQCSAGTAQSIVCDPAFVVDAVADLAGLVPAGQPTSAADTGTQLTSSNVIAVIRSHLQPGGFVLDFGPVPWSTDRLSFSVVEPDPGGPPVDGRTVWLVRGYLAGAASWLAVDDGTGQAWGPLATPVIPGPPAPGFPTTIEGLAVHSVGQARAAPRDLGGLVAIAGYLSNDRAPEGCPPAPTSGKPNPCSDTHLAMIDQPGSILLPNDQTFMYDLVIPPNTSSIRPLILPGTTAVDPWAGGGGLVARVGPQAVVLIGQFGDPRAPECAARPGGGSAGCDLSFVIDQVAWIRGVPQGPSVWTGSGLDVSNSPDEVARVVQGWLSAGGTSTIVSLTATAPADSLALSGIDQSNRSPGLLWIVRYTVAKAGLSVTSGYAIVEDGTLALLGSGP